MSILTDEIKSTLAFRNALRPPSKLENSFERLLRIYNLVYVRELQIGMFFADFALPEHKIVFEVDGNKYHKERKLKDEAKDRFLKIKGWRVYRLSWDDVNKSDVAFELLKQVVFEINPKRIVSEDDGDLDPILYKSCAYCGLPHNKNKCSIKVEYEEQ